MAQTAAVSTVVGLLALLVWDLAHQSAGKVARTVDSGKATVAPPWTRNRVDTTGTLSLASLRGKVVVLNFWQSYCAPCTHEAPAISAASRQWSGKNVVFVGVDVQDLRGPALKFIKRFNITYPIVADSGALVGHYGVTGYPETFFIDRLGRVVPAVPGGHIVGPATVETLSQGIRNALKE